MKLIADSGSTKTDWCLVSNDGLKRYVIQTIGFNPYFIDTQGIIDALTDSLLPELNPALVEEIYYYGAGCSTTAHKNTVKKALVHCFANTKTIVVEHDLLAAARALLGNKAGFAAILGTGTNTCIYDGKEIILNIDSLGYLLGDEGSGSNLGRRLLREFMRNQLPDNLQGAFAKYFNITNNEQIFKELYEHKYKNRYLASFCKFASDNKSNPYIRSLVYDGFKDFFKNLVSRYPNYTQYTLNCIGSIAYIYKDILEQAAAEWHMKLGEIIQSPLNNLVDFHVQQHA
jgi:N-acetylglucosamine kinase-like BadF-type ATPase